MLLYFFQSIHKLTKIIKGLPTVKVSGPFQCTIFSAMPTIFRIPAFLISAFWISVSCRPFGLFARSGISQRVPGTSAQKLVLPVQLACKPVYRPVCRRGQQLR